MNEKNKKNEKQEIDCIHFESCSGCIHQHQVDQLSLFEEARVFFKQRHIELPPLIAGPAKGWRHRAKLVVAPANRGHVVIGLYRSHSHDVQPIPHCLVHHPRLQQALAVVEQTLKEQPIPAYDEKRRVGLLRYLLLAFEEESQSVQLSFVVTERNLDLWKGFIQHLIKKDSSLWHSIWLNHNPRVDNVIWGETWDLLWGKPWLHTDVGMAQMALHPGSFFQANVPLFRRLVEELTLWVPTNCRLVELYSGCGVIGLHLAAARHAKVIFCERNPLSKVAFDASLARLPFEVREHLRVDFVVEAAEKALFLLDEEEGVEAVLVDPPRKGLDAALITALGTCKKGTQLYYISCGWRAFMRDCDALLGLGWRLKRAKGYLFFPGTEQIELLVQMEKE